MSPSAHDADDAAQIGGRLRGVLFLIPATVYFVGLSVVMGALGAVSGRFRRGGFVHLVRPWGRFPLWLFGVRLETTGLEHIEADGPKLILFNHVSLLDLFILAALCPRRPIVMYKKELSSVPGLGWALSTLDMISIDRANHEQALASLRSAGERLHQEGASVLMAPEGTRSRRGGLQRFKLGAFHLATTTGVPIVPMIMRGVDRVLPMGSFIVRSGRIRVDYLPPIDPTGWELEEVREHADEIREQFLQYLPPAPEPEPKQAKTG